MNLKFKLESSDNEIKQATKEYQEIWDKDGQNIISTIERVSGLSFPKEDINVTIKEKPSRVEYGQITLRASYPYNIKKSTLVHELIHILIPNKIIKEFDEPHNVIYLILFDIWQEIFGKEYAIKSVNFERSLSPRYDKCWSNVLKLSNRQRIIKFKSIINNGNKK